METLANIKHDKLLHFFYGTIISFIGIAMFGLQGLWFTVAIGAWKELAYDWFIDGGKPDIWDFLWTILPAGMFILLNFIS
jgi:hypothetical protein|tara:strand:+ start:808 stop:1047 length:240 start_codon:yes stop_codon:yes gene_type:complete